jgi:uridine kinase
MRFSASEALNQSIFNSYNKQKPDSFVSKIFLDVDSDDCFDYKTGKNHKFRIRDYISLIEKEVFEVHALSRN